MRETQLDSYSLWAERYRPRAVRAARRAGLDSLALRLERWDLRTETESRGAVPFFTWLYRLRELIVADEFEDGDGWFPDLAFMEIVETGDSAWIDDARTPEVERLEALEEAAARTAAVAPGELVGGSPSRAVGPPARNRGAARPPVRFPRRTPIRRVADPTRFAPTPRR